MEDVTFEPYGSNLFEVVIGCCCIAERDFDVGNYVFGNNTTFRSSYFTNVQEAIWLDLRKPKRTWPNIKLFTKFIMACLIGRGRGDEFVFTSFFIQPRQVDHDATDTVFAFIVNAVDILVVEHVSFDRDWLLHQIKRIDCTRATVFNSAVIIASQKNIATSLVFCQRKQVIEFVVEDSFQLCLLKTFIERCI